jgi:hypothetical protein
MTLLALSVFDFIDDYVQELGELEQLPSELDVEEPLVQFATQFFSQFFDETLGHQILAINATQAVELAVVAKLAQEPSLDLIVAAFRSYCQNYDTILGEHYDRGGERTAFQREFIPDLLQQIQKWAMCALTNPAEA